MQFVSADTLAPPPNHQPRRQQQSSSMVSIPHHILYGAEPPKAAAPPPPVEGPQDLTKVIIGGDPAKTGPFEGMSQSGRIVNAYNALVMAAQRSK